MVFCNSRCVTRNLISISASVFFLGFFAANTQAKIIDARSCSLTDVQTAINSAVSGDVIALPAGSASWSSSLIIAKTNLILMGNGVGSTIITGGSKSISLTGESANGLRITGIEFRAGSQLIYAAGSGTPRQAIRNLRVDHCKFVRTNVVIETKGGCTGVFDHCEFVDSYGARLYGSNDANARPPYKLGTSDALFFEDNKITATPSGSPPHFIASNSFSKYVIRHNVFDYQKSLWDIIDAHGACEVTGRGSATWEIYENTIKLVPSISRVIHLRGGQGVVFNNTFTGNYTPGKPITITDYALLGSSCSNGSCKSYPCPDMINHAYFWNNKIRTTPVNPVNVCPAYIKLNRDYYTVPMPGYTPFIYPHPLTKSTNGIVATEQLLKKAETAQKSLITVSDISGASTLISYSLEQRSPVKIAVFNINGVLVQPLVDEVQTTGSHSVSWDASLFPKGMYIIKTSIGDEHQNFKISR